MNTFYLVSGLLYLIIGVILLSIDGVFSNSYTRTAFYLVDIAFIVAGVILIIGSWKSQSATII